MRIYLAGLYTSRGGGKETLSVNLEVARVLAEAYPYDLESFHYLRRVSAAAKYYREKKKDIFLDSGAFSMFTQKIKVDLGEYASYIKKNQDIIHIASNLDEIGRGKEKESYHNQKTLERMGAKIQPVHHARDDDKWLLKYMAEGYDYIFLGGMVPETTPYLKGWLDHIFGKYLTRKDGSAKIKIHGFGLTTTDLMRRYPWTSVDSTSWVLAGRFGTIYLDLPHGDAKIYISDQSPARRDWDRHYDTLSPVARKHMDDFIIQNGYKPELLRTHYGWRDHWNIAFFQRMMNRPDPVFIHSRQAATLF